MLKQLVTEPNISPIKLTIIPYICYLKDKWQNNAQNTSSNKLVSSSKKTAHCGKQPEKS